MKHPWDTKTVQGESLKLKSDSDRSCLALRTDEDIRAKYNRNVLRSDESPLPPIYSGTPEIDGFTMLDLVEYLVPAELANDTRGTSQCATQPDSSTIRCEPRGLSGLASSQHMDLSNWNRDSQYGQVNVTLGLAQVGHYVLRMGKCGRVSGSQGSDVFTFREASDGDRYYVDGGAGPNRIDLGNLRVRDVTITKGLVEVDDGTMRFDITFRNIDEIRIAGSQLIPTDVFEE